jgi:hypothetical protein
MTGENFLPGKKDGERDRFGLVRFVYVFVILNIITASLRKIIITYFSSK